MVAVWLLIICFLGAVLFTDSVNARFSNHQMGRMNVSKYAEEHRNDDPLVIQNNTNCAKVTYPSLSIYSSPVDPDFATGAKVSFLVEPTYTLTAVNHHGRPNYVDFSGPLSGFASLESDGDTSMYVCVHKEPIEGFEEVDIEPHVSVDWMSFKTQIGLFIVIGAEETVFSGVVFLKSVLEFNYMGVDAAAVLVDMKPHNISLFSDEGTIWVNYYRLGRDPDDFWLHDFKIAALVSDLDTDEPQFSVDITTFILEESSDANYGKPPTPDSYLTEAGNVKLELPPENSTTDWTLLCTDYPFIQNYTSTPYVFISVSFRNKTSLDVVEPAITGWVEFVNEVGFRACVARPRYAAEVPVNASIPYLEYLVISQDGIYDEMGIDFLKHDLVITMELEFPAGYDVNEFLNVFDDVFWAISTLMYEMIEAGSDIAFGTYGYMAKPLLSQKVYLFNTYTALDSDDAANVETQLGIVFSDGYFPYIANISDSSAREIMDAIYPNGEPQSDEEKVKGKYWTNWGCPVGPFDPSATCSIAECDDNSNGGTKTISRVKLTENDSDFCPPLSIEVPCNLPPCSIEAQIFYWPESSTDLTWLWALIGVIVGLGVIGGVGYVIYKNMNNWKTSSEPLVGSFQMMQMN